ncbi:adenylyltransferase/sulfurtransferase [Methanomicrobium sp. W14]|uniref:HesA/MoeB/ThiF family protein n=1 Tax=Methanomicrobium sp. W14 TaxID=2817839 RepID=UPI001AEA2B36|nr:HesA/MoeB/ThiF family protein [Methanomicrobium sp. W14]MBP2134249.1 adenylyltransferase/sulfurtransferase [Methanomicrobium sp. W14]
MDISERYERQVMLFGEEAQKKLFKSSVLVAGAGGLGSPVCVYLSAAGIKKIVIADYDFVSLSNLNRQFIHDESAIGEMKTESARKAIERINGSVEVVTVDKPLSDDNITDICREEGCSLIADCLDNFDARRALNRAALNLEIPMVHGAVNGWDGQATTIIPGETPCFECMFPDSPPKEKFPIAGPTAGVIGSVQANEAIRVLAGLEAGLAGKLFVWDGRCSSADIIPFERDENCPVCSGMTFGRRHI